MSTVLDLGISNPSKMIRLAESIEAYERAIEQYRENSGDEQTLTFTVSDISLSTPITRIHNLYVLGNSKYDLLRY